MIITNPSRPIEREQVTLLSDYIEQCIAEINRTATGIEESNTFEDAIFYSNILDMAEYRHKKI